VPPDRHEIRPAAWRFALLVLGLIAFVALGLWLLTAGGWFTIPLGILTIAFFGGGGVYALYRMSRGVGRLAIVPEGIEYTMFGPAPRVIPWTDIEAIDVLKIADQEFTAIRLKRYESLVDGLTDDDARSVLRHFQAMRVMGYATVAVGAMHSADASGVKRLLAGSEHVKSVIGVLQQARQTCGAEILLGWNMRDRGAREFANYLEERRRSCIADSR
jgi:hypothetical protein